MKKILFLCFLILTSSFSLEAQEDGYFPELLGIWLSENKKQKVKVFYSKKHKMYYGKIVYMYEDDASQGREMLDKNNPDPKLRSRRVTGINLLHSLKYVGNRKFKGYIYDPVSGSDYSCNLTLRPDNKTVEIRGYIFLPWIGRTEIATKVE